MRPKLCVLGLASLWISLSACSDEKRAEPSDVFGGSATGGSGSGGSSQNPSVCHEYCQMLVDEAAGCEAYNNGGRCELICDFYMNGACETTYTTFTSCLQETKQASCTPASSGKLALVVESCNDEFTAWIECRDERDAGICPY